MEQAAPNRPITIIHTLIANSACFCQNIHKFNNTANTKESNRLCWFLKNANYAFRPRWIKAHVDSAEV